MSDHERLQQPDSHSLNSKPEQNVSISSDIDLKRKRKDTDEKNSVEFEEQSRKKIKCNEKKKVFSCPEIQPQELEDNGYSGMDQNKRNFVEKEIPNDENTLLSLSDRLPSVTRSKRCDKKAKDELAKEVSPSTDSDSQNNHNSSDEIADAVKPSFEGSYDDYEEKAHDVNKKRWRGECIVSSFQFFSVISSLKIETSSTKTKSPSYG